MIMNQFLILVRFVTVISVWRQLLATSTPSTTGIKGQLNVGAIFPTIDATGALNTVAMMRQAGFILAVREINNKTDGIFDDILPNVHVRIAVRDSHQTFANTVLAALDMIKTIGVQAVIGAGDDFVSEALASILQGVDLPQISYGSTAAELSHSENYPTFMRVVPSDAYQGTVIADMIRHKFGWTRAIAFASSDNFGADAILEFRHTAQVNGLVTTYEGSFTTGTVDFSGLIAEALPFDCRVFAFLISSPADAAILLMQGFDAGLFSSSTTFFFTLQLDTPALYRAVVQKYGHYSLRGAIQLYPSIQYWKTQPTGKVYLQRYLSQPDTVTVVNGRQICHNDTDDTGRYLYRVVPTTLAPNDPSVCAGLQFGHYKADGSDTSTYMGFVYDATMAYFQAIDYLLKHGNLTLAHLNTTHISGRMIKSVMASRISFEGVTGMVDFSSGRISSKTYGYGDRKSAQGYVIYNYQVANSSYGSMQRIGRWSDESSYVDCSAATPLWTGGCHLPLQTASADGYSIVADRQPDVVQRMPDGLKGFLLFLALVSFLCGAGLALTIFALKAHTRLVKASQPLMMGFIVLGYLVGAARILMSFLDTTDAVCHMNIWFGHMSFSLIFFAMTVKTWRVHRIILGGLRKVKITTFQVGMYTTGLCAGMAVVLVLYSTVGSPHVEYRAVPLVTGNRLLKPVCVASTTAFDAVLFSAEGVALLAASYLCYCTKGAMDAVNESQYIATGTLTTANHCLPFPSLHSFLYPSHITPSSLPPRTPLRSPHFSLVASLTPCPTSHSSHPSTLPPLPTPPHPLPTPQPSCSSCSSPPTSPSSSSSPSTPTSTSSSSAAASSSP